MKIIVLLICFTVMNATYAKEYLLLIGGGGEPNTETTIFDSGLFNFGKNLKKSKWNYNVSFNGGHPITEKILKNQYSTRKSPVTDFTSDNYTKLLESYKNNILNGTIKSGDQLMIIIYTHGAKGSDGQLTHSIAATGSSLADLNTLSGANLVSLDKLEEIVKLTNERGIYLGIADLTCHSGATLALKKNAPNTCIITSTSPDHLGYTGPDSFSDIFLKYLSRGQSLESIFLKARATSKDSSFPMISTDENNTIVSDIYKGISPYLFFNDFESDK